MGDNTSLRRALAGGVILILLGAVNLVLGTEPMWLVGWGVLAFGVAGVVAAVAQHRGWITPGRRSAPGRKPVAAPEAPTDPPQLSVPGREQVARIVAELHAAGVLAPEAPDPAHLYETAADHGESVTVEAVLAGLDEASWYHPGFRTDRYTANLVRHEIQVEQSPEYLRDQIDDLVRLAAGGLSVDVSDVRQDVTGMSRRIPTRIRWSVNGSDGVLDYAGAPKQLSSVLHVALARATAGAPRRPASFWTDQALWITTLPTGGVERLNAALGLGPDDPSSWEWLDAQDPVAAGDLD